MSCLKRMAKSKDTHAYQHRPLSWMFDGIHRPTHPLARICTRAHSHTRTLSVSFMYDLPFCSTSFLYVISVLPLRWKVDDCARCKRRLQQSHRSFQRRHLADMPLWRRMGDRKSVLLVPSCAFLCLLRFVFFVCNCVLECCRRNVTAD